jgi:hypothetical protein
MNSDANILPADSKTANDPAAFRLAHFGYVFCVSATMLLAFLLVTGTLTSGFHFIDDHELLRIDQGLGNRALFESMVAIVHNDLGFRFRPLFFVHRVLQVKIFGPDFLALSIYVWVLASFAFATCYIGLRRMGHSLTLAGLGVCIIFLGTQMAIWWRLGPAETLGACFLGFSVMFLGLSRSYRHRTLYSWLFAVALALAALSKESFLIAVPGFLWLKLWLDMSFFSEGPRTAVRRNYSLAIPLGAFVVGVSYVFCVIGPNRISYAGTPASTADVITGIGASLFNESGLGPWLLLTAVVGSLLAIDLFWEKEKILRVWRRNRGVLMGIVVFAVLVVLANLFLYVKPGMFERYLLPSTFAFAYLNLALTHVIRKRFLTAAAVASMAILSIAQLHAAYREAVLFSEEGERTNRLLGKILATTTSASPILLVVDPVHRFEASWSLKSYLAYHEREHLFAHALDHQMINSSNKTSIDTWKSWFVGERLEDLNSIPEILIVLDPIEQSTLFELVGLPEDSYELQVPRENHYFAYCLRGFSCVRD